MFRNDKKGVPQRQRQDFKEIPEDNKFTLTLIEATEALSRTGKWDKNYMGERPSEKCDTPDAKEILELAVTRIPSKIIRENEQWSVYNSKLDSLFSIINKPPSKVRVLDLSQYDFDALSLKIIAHSIKEYLNPQSQGRTFTIKLNANQPELIKEILDTFAILERSHNVKIELVQVKPSPQARRV